MAEEAEIEEFEEIDLIIELNTENGQNATVTNNKLRGELDCIIIESMNDVSIVVNSQLGYNILTKFCKKGTRYIAPRAKTQYNQDELAGFPQQSKFNLNEKLDIIIQGQTNTDVKLIFRFS